MIVPEQHGTSGARTMIVPGRHDTFGARTGIVPGTEVTSVPGNNDGLIFRCTLLFFHKIYSRASPPNRSERLILRSGLTGLTRIRTKGSTPAGLYEGARV